MTTRAVPKILLAAGILSTLLWTPSAHAQQTGDIEKAEKVRDRAIAKIEAWRAKPAENILDKDRDAVGDTQPFGTADALLSAMHALTTNDKAVKKSVKTLTDLAKSDPGDPVAEFYRGMVLTWLGENDAANGAWKGTESRARKLIEADPEDASAQYFLGASLIRQKKEYDAARKALKAAADAGYDAAMVEFQTGLSYLLQEKWQQAKDAFDKVEKSEPRFAHLYYYRALAWDKLKRTDMLLNDLDQFVKLAPDAPEAKTAHAILSSAN